MSKTAFRFQRMALLSLATAFSMGVQAQDIFDLTLNVNGQSTRVGFNTVEQMFNRLDKTGLESLDKAYTDTAAASLTLGYRGLNLFVTTTADNNAVILNIPGIVDNKSFTGANRDASFDLLNDFFESDGGALVSAVMKKLAEVSPVDPIAGNPNSMQSMMVSNDFAATFTAHATNIKSAPNAQSSDNSGLAALGLRFGQYTQNGLKSESVTLPLSYTFRGFGEGRQLTLNMPISSGTVGTAKIYQAGFGVAYRHPVNGQWALTPAVNVGASGSADLGSAAAMTSASLTSQYSIPLQDYEVSIGNMVGQYDTLKIKTEEYSYDPGIRNLVFRNGVMIAKPVMIGGKPMAVEASFVNTQFTGTALYNKWTNELGLTLGTQRGSDLPSYLRAGITLLQGQNSKGVSFNFGYWF